MKEVHHPNYKNIGENHQSSLLCFKNIENVKEGNGLNICLGVGNWYGIKIRVNYVLGY